MDKCEGCPMRYDKYPIPDMHCEVCAGLNLCITHRLADAEKDCHLTPDHQRFIDAMIRGVFNCGHCGKKTGYRPDAYVLCTHGLDPQYVRLDRFCPAWQERKEGEDG
jgi:hypothetical protein